MAALLSGTLGRGIRIQLSLEPRLWPAFVDPTQVAHAILNLAINARDAMPGGGTLSIETANVVVGSVRRPDDPLPGEYVMVSISDTGTGMPEEVLAQAFDPFFTTKSPGQGSGLGLSQVYGLVKQSGGATHITSQLGHGTTVTLYLPRAAS